MKIWLFGQNPDVAKVIEEMLRRHDQEVVVFAEYSRLMVAFGGATPGCVVD